MLKRFYDICMMVKPSDDRIMSGRIDNPLIELLYRNIR
ncbi:hypothetical protein EVA_02430 [gut metagenome]|uniref:Uncharacterized protein n=1 Tax=gut metagenome TaxID=749906 RepID=J9GN31_9ZZZZ